MSAYPKWLRDAASRGGKVTGTSKVRGDADYYKRISKKAAQARKRKAANDSKLSHGDGQQSPDCK